MTVRPRRDDVPGPRGSLLAGSARALLRDQLGTYEQARRDHGDIARFRIGPPRIGFVFDAVFHPNGARQVLATDADRYDKGVPVVAELARVVGDGLVTSHGPCWQTRRRTIQPLFTRQRVASYAPLIEREAARIVAGWAPAATAGRSVDLHDAAIRFSLRVLGSAVLGGDVEYSAPTLAATLPVLNEHVTRRGLSPLRLPTWIPSRRNRQAAAAHRELVGLVDQLVQAPRDRDEADDLVTRLLAARDPESGAALDERAVRDEALTFIVAGPRPQPARWPSRSTCSIGTRRSKPASPPRPETSWTTNRPPPPTQTAWCSPARSCRRRYASTRRCTRWCGALSSRWRCAATPCRQDASLRSACGASTATPTCGHNPLRSTPNASPRTPPSAPATRIFRSAAARAPASEFT